MLTGRSHTAVCASGLDKALHAIDHFLPALMVLFAHI
jgi:hypothetical protein